MPDYSKTQNFNNGQAIGVDAQISISGSGAHGQWYGAEVNGVCVGTASSEANQRCWSTFDFVVREGDVVTGVGNGYNFAFNAMTPLTSKTGGYHLIANDCLYLIKY